jgi:hypothetical protein
MKKIFMERNKMKYDFDLVIQGPLDPISLGCLERQEYLFNKIIISHWSCDEINPEVQMFLQRFGADEKYEIVTSVLPYDKQNHMNPHPFPGASTFFYSITSTFNGLKKSTSKYCIKMRSDEMYDGLELLMDRLLEDDDKVISGNIFFKSPSVYPHHMGDHLFAAKTKRLKETYTILYSIYDEKRFVDEFPWAYQMVTWFSPESILARCFLLAKELQIDSREVFLEEIIPFDINLFNDYVAQWKHAKIVFKKKNNPFVPQHYDGIQ